MAGPEDRSVETSRAVAAGLWEIVTLALEEPPAGHTQLGGDSSGHELGLIEAPASAAPPARRRPRDHVDVGRPDAGGEQPIDEETGDVVTELATVAVLEPQDDVARPAGEGQRRDDVARPRQRDRGGKGEPAGTAQHRTDTITTSTTGVEDHAPDHDEGVSQPSRDDGRDTPSSPR